MRSVNARAFLPVMMILLCLVGTGSCADDTFNIELKQKDAEVYHEQSIGKNEFNYGYQVEKTNSQFQHKAKGPDDVTYGCYGYIDPDGEKHLVYYIADRLGYRLLAPDQPTKVFTERVANSVNKLDADLQGRKLDEKVVAWNDLYLPSTCRRLNEIITITPPETPSVPDRSNGGALIQGPPQGNKNSVPVNINIGKGPSSGAPAPAPIEKESKQPKPEVTISPDIPAEPIVNNGSGLFGGSLGDNSTFGFGVPSEGTTTARAVQETTSTTLRPSTPHANYGPFPTPSQEASPAPKQVDPLDLLPKTTYLPLSPTPRPPASHPAIPLSPPHSNCDHRGSDSPSAHPKFPPQVGQFNGFVFPINRNCDDSGRNTAELLAQMQSINELVLQVSSTLHSLIDAGVDRNASTNASTCQRVLELLNIQQPVPLLVYVPIMMPYLDAQKPPINPASYAFASACSQCK